MTSPTTAGAAGRSARGAERGISLVAPAMRAVVLVQIVLSVPAGARLATSSPAYVAVSLAAAIVSVLLIVQCLAHGSVRRGWWHVPDIVLAWVAVAAMTLLLPASHLVGTWESWASGFAINVGALAATWMRPLWAVAHGFALGGWYTLWASQADATSWETLVNNAITVPGYAIVVGLVTHYLRALAADADRSRDEAVKATRALELSRYQLAVHDASSILRLLSDEDTPAEVLPSLRVQANREATRLRNYLSAQPHATPVDRTVGTMLKDALTGFEDLPLELAVELGSHARLTGPVWEATARAVATVLHNVRLHAGANQVVVHADCDGDTWEVVVSDDGRGFDQSSQPLGFGLNTQVGRALSEVGVSAEIRSTPGHGTSVTLVGPVEEAGQE